MKHGEERKRTGVLVFTGKVLNEAGGAVVDIFDLSSAAVGKMVSIFKKAPDLPKKAKKIVSDGIEIVKPSETKIIEKKIKKKKDKIEELYREIGKEGVKSADSDIESLLTTEGVKSLISDVREYEKQIARLKGRITELEEEKKKDALDKIKVKEKAAVAKEKEKIDEVETKDMTINDAIETLIRTSLGTGAFKSASEKTKFRNVANDLLDGDMEVKILAVTELGKMKISAAMRVLIEAIKFDDPNLSSEIINALINIGDSGAVPVFKEKVEDSNYRVRIACLRGLYKLAEDDEDAIKLLSNALMDEHPDVRRSAITFIGWRNNVDAVPALVQCLKDEDEKVRKASLSALGIIRDKSAVLPLIRALKNDDLEVKRKILDSIKMITGEEITFDFQASGEELSKAMDGLVNWWKEKNLDEVEISKPETEAVAEKEAVEEPAEPEEDVETFSEENLKKRLKSELISICTEFGIEYDEKLTKAELTQLILEKKEQ